MDEDVILCGQTFDEIMERMLANVPDSLDKREGSVIYNALAPAAIEMQLLYEECALVANEAFADTASLEYLARRAAERGIMHKGATFAVVRGQFEPIGLDLVGYRFALLDKDINYTVTEVIEPGAYRLESEADGSAGNNDKGQLIPIYSDAVDDDQSSRLTVAKITGIIDAGIEEEDVEAFRKRYFDSIENQAFGGNIADYKSKLLEQGRVGGVKVYPTWNGGGSVKLVLLNSAYAVPDSLFIADMQALVDPETNHGEGKGIAPIGHIVTVEAAAAVAINVAIEVVYAEGFTPEAALPSMQVAVGEYLLALRIEWGANDSLTGSIVRISHIENKLLNLDAILDVQVTGINGFNKNVVLNPNQVPVLGGFTSGITGA